MTTPAVIIPVTGTVSESFLAKLKEIGSSFGLIEKASDEAAAQTGRSWQLTEKVMDHFRDSANEALGELKEKGAAFVKEMGDSVGKGFGDVGEVLFKTASSLGPIGQAGTVIVGVFGLAYNAIKASEKATLDAENQARTLAEVNGQLGASYASVAASQNAAQDAQQNIDAARAAGQAIAARQLALIQAGFSGAQADDLAQSIDAIHAAMVRAGNGTSVYTTEQVQAALASANTEEQMRVLGVTVQHTTDTVRDHAVTVRAAQQAAAEQANAATQAALRDQVAADARLRAAQRDVAMQAQSGSVQQITLRAVERAQEELTAAIARTTTSQRLQREVEAVLSTQRQVALHEVTSLAPAEKALAEARARANDRTRESLGPLSQLSQAQRRVTDEARSYGVYLRQIGVDQQTAATMTEMMTARLADQAAALARVSQETGTLSDVEKAAANARQRDADKARRMAAGNGPTAAEVRAAVEALRVARAANDNSRATIDLAEQAAEAQRALAFTTRELAIAQARVERATRGAVAAVYDHGTLVSRHHAAHHASLEQRRALTQALTANAAAHQANTTAILAESDAMREKIRLLREQALALTMLPGAGVDQAMSPAGDRNASAAGVGRLNEPADITADAARQSATDEMIQQAALADVEKNVLAARLHEHETYTGRLRELQGEQVNGAVRAADFTNAAFQSVGKALGNHIQAFVAGKESIGAALEGMLADTLTSIGQEAMVKGAFETAQGLSALAGIVTAGLAPGHFAAAGAYFGVGALALAGGAALSPAPSVATGGAGGGAGGMLPDRASGEGGGGLTIVENNYAPRFGGREGGASEVGQRMDRYTRAEARRTSRAA